MTNGSPSECAGRLGVESLSSEMVDVTVTDSVIDTWWDSIHIGSGPSRVRLLGDNQINGWLWFYDGDDGPVAGLDDKVVVQPTGQTSIDGSVVFHGGDDRLVLKAGAGQPCIALVGATCSSSITIRGELQFGDGDDALVLHAGSGKLAHFDIHGPAFNLERLDKSGSGTVRLPRDLHVVAPRSAFSLRDGTLVLRGALDLGARGTMTIRDAGRLSFEAGDVSSSPLDHGSVRAGGGLWFVEGAHPALQLELDSELVRDPVRRARAMEALRDHGIRVLGAGTRIHERSARRVLPRYDVPLLLTATGAPVAHPRDALPGNLVDGDTGRTVIVNISDPVPPKPGKEPPPRAPHLPERPWSGGPGLMAALTDQTLGGSTDAASGFSAGSPGLVGTDIRGVDESVWTRAFAGDVGGATLSGVTVGVDHPLGQGFRARFAATPSASAASSRDAASLEGSVLALGAGWSDGALSADLQLARSDASVDERSLSPLVGPLTTRQLSSAQTHLEARAGLSLDAGPLVFKPSFSAFGGLVERDPHTAHADLFAVDVPALERGYHGWGARIVASPRSWLPAATGVRWRPTFSLSNRSTDTGGPDFVALRHRHIDGVLDFVSDAPARVLPETEMSASFSLDVGGRSDDWSLSFGAIVAERDGDTDAAVRARFGLRF